MPSGRFPCGSRSRPFASRSRSARLRPDAKRVHPRRMQAVRVVVHGRVQGVGFRAWVVREAIALGVGGRVWNLADGGVEAEAVGSAAALERFVAALRTGPRLARVEQVSEQWFESREIPRDFQVTG